MSSEEKKMYKVVIKRPGKNCVVKQIDGSLKSLYKAIGCGCDMIEALCIGENCGQQWIAYIDEEGKYRTEKNSTKLAQQPHCRGDRVGHPGDIIFGSIVIIGLDNEGDNAQLSDDAIQEIKTRFNELSLQKY